MIALLFGFPANSLVQIAAIFILSTALHFSVEQHSRIKIIFDQIRTMKVIRAAHYSGAHLLFFFQKIK